MTHRPRLSSFSKSRGFTIVELLVVISIIALLCATLLPSLTRAREMARRVICSSNERQMFVAAGAYAMDSAEALPPVTYGGLGFGTTGYIYGETAYSPVRRYLSDYCGLGTNISMAANGLISDHKNMLYCPSQIIVNTISDDDWRHHTGYGFRAFGWFGTSSAFGTSRFFAVGERGPLGPKVFLMDYITGPTNTHAFTGTNHNYEGGNVCAGDGSAKWVPFANTFLDANPTYVYAPLGYYSQTYYPAVTDTTSPYYGELILYDPFGVPNGQNHQPQMWGPNRTMYGYRNP